MGRNHHRHDASLLTAPEATHAAPLPGRRPPTWRPRWTFAALAPPSSAPPPLGRPCSPRGESSVLREPWRAGRAAGCTSCCSTTETLASGRLGITASHPRATSRNIRAARQRVRRRTQNHEGGHPFRRQLRLLKSQPSASPQIEPSPLAPADSSAAPAEFRENSKKGAGAGEGFP